MTWTFVRLLRVLRKERELTQAQLEQLSGVHQQHISRIECGRETPMHGSVVLVRLAKALDYTEDPDDLTHEVWA